ncbi:MAG: hypothetical protein IPF54_26080 [Draconibacterium sp.]|nr:hypothetical protein [Draconibacterium sp.]
MNRPVMTIEPAALKRLEHFPFLEISAELENMIERAIVVGNGKNHLKRFTNRQNRFNPAF